MATEETTITELELAEEVLEDMVIPVDTSTDTKSVSLKQLRAWLGSSLPTGFILPAVGRIDDERFSLLDGKTLSKQGTYGAFCAKVEKQVQAGNWFACTEEEYNADLLAYGQCGKFVIGTDYVRIPTITRFIGATITLSEIGKSYAESLPNIKSEVYTGIRGIVHTASGAIKGVATTVADWGGSGSQSLYNNFELNANLSSSTYQDGAKVQPDHTKYPYYMVISTEGQTAEVEIDINQVYEDMNLKANSDLSNVASVSQTFKEQSVSWGMPDTDSGVDVVGSIVQGSQYIPPQKGFLFIYVWNDGVWVLKTSKNGTYVVSMDEYNSRGHSALVPIDEKGLYCETKKQGNGAINAIFYPCKGVN